MNDHCEVLMNQLFSVIYRRKVSDYNRDLFADTELRKDRTKYVMIYIYFPSNN